MPVNYDALMASNVSSEPRRYGDTDAMLYALATGFGQDSAERHELDYVYEGRALKTVPSMGGNLLDFAFLDDSGLAIDRVLQSEQQLTLYRPLPAAAELVTDRQVVAVFDHGRDVGASILVESETRMAKDETVLFTLVSTLLATADGGFGGPSGSPPFCHRLPSREPDLTCDLRSRADQALLFRLTGDRNPLYADEREARALGFDNTPLPAQCVAGIACRAILKTICEYDFTLISGFDLAFASPMYPGEELRTEMWQDRNIVSFRCIAKARNTVVVDHGRCTLAA